METTIYYNEHNINVGVYWDSTHIEDSYRIKTKRDMRNVLELIRLHTDGEGMAINRLRLRRQVREWRAHNLLYALGIARSHTKDVDLNENKWYVRAAYGILSLMYWRV